MKSHQNSPEDFPEFRIDKLELYARRWVDKYRKVPIERIVLYRYNPRHQEHYEFVESKRIPIKYAVALEVSGDVDPTEYTRFVANTEYCRTVHEHPRFRAFIDAGFSIVYKQPQENNFEDEWILIPVKAGEGVPVNIMIEEPYCVLFDCQEAEDQEGFEIGIKILEISNEIDDWEGRTPRNVTEKEIISRQLRELYHARDALQVSERFSQLNLEKLKVCAHKWVKEFPVVEKVILYSGRKKGNNFVLVFIVPKITDPEDPLFQNSEEFYEKIAGTLLPFEEDLLTVYKGKSPTYYISQWDSFVEDPRDGLPVEFIVDEFPYVLYETEEDPSEDSLTFKRTEWMYGTDLSLECPDEEDLVIEKTATGHAVETEVENIDQIPNIAFCKHGDFWLIGEKGKEKYFKHTNGLSYLHYLIERPGGIVPVIDLYHLGPPNPDAEKPAIEDDLSDEQESSYQKIDEKTKNQIEADIEKFNEEIEMLQSGRNGNPEEICGQIEERKGKISQLETYLKEAKRYFKGENKRIQNNARITVQKAIKTALANISKEDSSIEQFLKLRNAREASEREKPGIVTGSFCSYQPDPDNPVNWILDPAETKNS